ncbi:GIY-YIG nuclease family protein [Micromonospora echinospora]|uniref:GIY-YIG nuclease family protein n=1 Tax=Micromonospora echinospora TaxID=1877 RepID=UPI0037B2CF54
MANSAEFRLSITRALGDQLAESLSKLAPAPLDLPGITGLAPRPGVYQLYEDDTFVYVGKADNFLPGRLMEHFTKLSGRLHVGRMTFACLYVEEDLHAVAPEKLLIARYKGKGQAPWNNNGFGNNDPGKERDTTDFSKKPNHFDVLHPANLDWVCDGIGPGRYTVDKLLKRLKDDLPYVFRYQRAAFHKDLAVDVTCWNPTADELFRKIASTVAVANPLWQITALPGYVIMYPKSGPYPSARRIYS